MKDAANVRMKDGAADVRMKDADADVRMKDAAAANLRWMRLFASRAGKGMGTEATTADDVEDHVSDSEFKLLRLDANAGENCVACDEDCSIPSDF